MRVLRMRGYSQRRTTLYCTVRCIHIMACCNNVASTTEILVLALSIFEPTKYDLDVA